MADSNSDCFVCARHSGAASTLAGVVFEDGLVYASHSMFPPGETKAYLGYLIVEPRRHVEGLQNLNKRESESLGVLISRLSRALTVTEKAEHVYLFVLGHHIPHLHFHLIPRYPNTPREWWGVRLDEWPGAPRGGTAEIAALCGRLRDYLAVETNDSTRENLI